MGMLPRDQNGQGGGGVMVVWVSRCSTTRLWWLQWRVRRVVTVYFAWTRWQYMAVQAVTCWPRGGAGPHTLVMFLVWI
jgi:hypothetical protein